MKVVENIAMRIATAVQKVWGSSFLNGPIPILDLQVQTSVKSLTKKFFVWVVLLNLGTAWYHLKVLQADPVDDFRFSYENSSPQAHSISTQAISVILKDRLDLFPVSQVPKLAEHVVNLCEKYHFDPAFVLALIHVESSFRLKVRSPVGALGLMQLMPDTARFTSGLVGLSYKNERQLTDPFFNITLGVAYLAHLRDRYRGVAHHYLAAYNAGPGKMDQLLARKRFQPRQTKEYYERIRRQLWKYRYYLQSES